MGVKEGTQEKRRGPKEKASGDVIFKHWEEEEEEVGRWKSSQGKGRSFVSDEPEDRHQESYLLSPYPLLCLAYNRHDWVNKQMNEPEYR